MFTSNPILNKKSFYTAKADRKKTFSIQGAITKSLILLAFITTVAFATWYYGLALIPFGKHVIGISGVAAFVTAIIIRYKREWASWLSFVYGTFKGVFLGAISANYNAQFDGIVAQAVFLTLAVFILMLVLYLFKIIKVSQKLRSIVMTATGAILLIYLVSFLLYLFDLPPIPYIHENGWIGIAFSVFVTITASFHLLLDFDFFERARNYKYPNNIEWYAAFGLVISIIWQYLSLLRLLKKVKSR